MQKLFKSFALLIIFTLIGFISVKAQPIYFIGDIITARNWAKEQNKLIFVYIESGNCSPCRKMEVSLFNEPRIYQYFNEHFISLDLSVNRRLDYRQRFGIRRLPTLIIMDHSEFVLWRHEGSISTGTLLNEAKRENGNRFHLDAEMRDQINTLEGGRLVTYIDSLERSHGENAAVTVANYYYREKKDKSNISPSTLFVKYLPKLEKDLVNKYINKNTGKDLKDN